MRVVTIDGPAGAGKSTVARRLADLRAGSDLTSDIELGALVETLAVRLPAGRVLLGDEDVTLSIRKVEVTHASKYIADSPSVRRLLMVWQREFAANADVVTEGRDQGTLVFPDAFRKYYLTATDKERARRRVAEHRSRGEIVTFESVFEDQCERDARDSARAIAPMKPAPDATILDTTGLTIDEVVDGMARDIEYQSRRS
jgi:cytidylate kinase